MREEACHSLLLKEANQDDSTRHGVFLKVEPVSRVKKLWRERCSTENDMLSQNLGVFSVPPSLTLFTNILLVSTIPEVMLLPAVLTRFLLLHSPQSVPEK